MVVAVAIRVIPAERVAMAETAGVPTMGEPATVEMEATAPKVGVTEGLAVSTPGPASRATAVTEGTVRETGSEVPEGTVACPTTDMEGMLAMEEIPTGSGAAGEAVTVERRA
jgi:hypothetical protein